MKRLRETNIAIVHDSLMEFGGAERVLASILEIWPKVDVFASTARKEVVRLLPKGQIFQSFLGKIPFIKRKPSFLQLLSPIVWRSFSLEKYDIVISSSSFGLSNTVRVKRPLHIAYVYQSPKNLFSLEEQWELQKLIPYSKIIAAYYKSSLRKTKYIATDSYYMKSLLKKLFNVKSKVIYPPVKIPKTFKRKPEEFFITTSRLGKEKNIDLAIRACNKLSLRLKIIGIGKNFEELKKIAGSTIEFLGFVSDKKRDRLYEKAKAFIFCAKNEALGIAPVEALARGLPVIAHYSGGVKETVIDNKTGLFFYKHTPEALLKVLKNFKPEKFNPRVLHNHAKKFSEDRFKKEFKQYVNSLLLKT